LPLSALKQVLGKVMKVALLSPDTGQQGGSSSDELDVHALSGKAVRTLFVDCIMTCSIFRCAKRSVSSSSSTPFYFLLLAVSFSAVAVAQAQSNLPLAETVITAGRVLQRAQDALPDVSVITRADIERAQAKDLPSLLQNLAGMEVSQSGGMGGVATLFMRGAESRHALVLVDGLPMNNLNFNLASLEHVSLSGIERIEVVRGNVSSLYGSAALGGVIQIFTRQSGGKGDKAPWLEVSGQVGSNDYRNATASAVKQWASGLGLNAATESIQSKGYNAINGIQRPGTNPDRDGYKRESQALNLSQDFESGRIGLVMRETHSKVQYDSQFGPANQADESQSVLRNALLSGTYKASKDLQWDVSVGQQEDKLNAAVTAYPYYVNSKSDTSAVGAVWTLWTNHALTSGYENTRQKIASDTEYSPANRSVNSWRMGYQAKLEDQQWQFNMRRDQYSDFGEANTWYAGYAYLFTPALRLKASASTGFMAPTFNDLYYPYGGNPLLKPEQAKSKELGLQYTQAQWHAKATYFDNQYSNLIDNDQNWTRTNIAKAKNQGLEISAAWQTMLPDWGPQQWRLSMTQQDPQNELTHQALARRAKTLAQAGLSQSLGDWDAGMQWRYSGQRMDGAKTLAPYTLLDFTATRAITPELRLNLRLENATNVSYQTIYGYNMPSRGFFLGLKWTPAL